MLLTRATKKALGPAQMRDHARYLQVAYGSSERRACGVLTFGRSTRLDKIENFHLELRLGPLACLFPATTEGMESVPFDRA